MATENKLFDGKYPIIEKAFNKRTIFADDVLLGIETFKQCYKENESNLTPLIVEISLKAVTMVEEFVKRTPSVDVVQVVHGRWLSLEEYAQKIGANAEGYAGGWCFCSECEQQMREIYGWAYCPNCGAKMDGEKK